LTKQIQKYFFTQKKIKYLQQNIYLDSSDSELIAVVGENGVGKSTFLRTIAFLQNSISGKIIINGKEINNFSRNELAKIISFVSTDLISYAHIDVYTLISQGRFPYTNWIGKLQDADVEIVENAISLLNLHQHKYKYINEISDGERQRALIARALVQDTKIIILDEPTAFLDLSNKYQITAILKRLSRDENKTIIFSSHDFNIVLNEADKIWLFNKEKVFSGAPEDLIINNSFDSLFINSNLKFSIEKADFINIKNKTKKIFIKENVKYKTLTIRALERLSFEITDNKNVNLRIEIIEQNKMPLWILNFNINEKAEMFNSIYMLANFLRKFI